MFGNVLLNLPCTHTIRLTPHNTTQLPANFLAAKWSKCNLSYAFRSSDIATASRPWTSTASLQQQRTSLPLQMPWPGKSQVAYLHVEFTYWTVFATHYPAVGLGLQRRARRPKNCSVSYDDDDDDDIWWTVTVMRHRSSAILTQLSATTCYPLDLLSQHCCNVEPATYASQAFCKTDWRPTAATSTPFSGANLRLRQTSSWMLPKLNSLRITEMKLRCSIFQDWTSSNLSAEPSWLWRALTAKLPWPN